MNDSVDAATAFEKTLGFNDVQTLEAESGALQMRRDVFQTPLA